ncbi:IclR family transcriptional regulator [Mycolicibacterium holsaticum]|jgi:DNA-binding IclR family transcriptional regulator|uniref:IclR-ED domain-containing protein n=1 Tax=Mycolicibacterium holsaticum TaxID=152142 RepID=A0A1E3RAX8_9MYCO|nr:IclR family transcriptional regulator C-terminal domain-containing protein [Mycolicibacterium holsaticum]MDA4107108.1 IclR family transcriptional regulator [Mycolicibacterium holsaticum DSM 44478 = JCM 12374]ODQ86969.1 hypothetical protein BHQ17_19270 [Mycolicibacterium holsaticum]QZA11320.1 helix-turn-helix domain-containing protein [Mycolicibacterium holsaticum DSM 44478 = JCM 12374]UNC11189.1 helix-turn-helix domain-containing protein [Mycolicibacterium holsaticum DSM 44478 = JCM 12374]
MAGNSTDPGRSVTSKVTAILMAFAGGPVLTLTEIASIAKLPTSTAHRLASELLAWRLLERTEDGGYRIGLPLRIIGKGGTDLDAVQRMILTVRARPVLVELARTARADAKLGVLNGHQVVLLGQGGRTSAADMDTIAPALPAISTAMGRALLAFSSTGVVDRAIAGGLHTAPKMLSPESLRQALSVIRLTRLASVRDEFDAEKVAVAMPVFSGGGKVAAALELTVHEPTTDIEAVTGALAVACRSLSRQLATEGARHRDGLNRGASPSA